MIGVIVASSILLFSAVGLGYFAARKIPLLLLYPLKEEGNSPKEVFKRILGRVRESRAMHQVASPDLLLQNLLSKTRIAALKTESKTAQVLEKMRKKSQEKNGNSKFTDDYWKKLRRKKV